jgi:hypothetical protein
MDATTLLRVPCTAKTMFCFGCGQRFTCWDRLSKHLAAGGHPHERGNAKPTNAGAAAPRKRKAPKPAAPFVVDAAQEERFRRVRAHMSRSERAHEGVQRPLLLRDA